MSTPKTIEKQEKIIKISVLIYQAIAIIAFIALPILSFRWWQTPFIGAFVEHTMVFNGAGPTNKGEKDSRWALFSSEVELGDQLLAIDEQEVTNAGELSNVLSTYEVGDEVQITYEQVEGGIVNKEITLIAFSGKDKFRYFYFPYTIGLIYLGLSLWMTKLRLDDVSGRAFILFSTSLSLGAAALFSVHTTHHLTILWFFSVALSGGSILDLALNFPREFSFTKKYPYIRAIGYVIALILSLLALPTIYNLQASYAYVQSGNISMASQGLLFSSSLAFSSIAATPINHLSPNNK